MSNKFRLGQPYSEVLSGNSTDVIKDTLQGVCYKAEEGNYTRMLTEEELGYAKSELADVDITLDKINTEKKEAMDEFKELLKQPTLMHKQLLTNIKNKSISREGVLFLVDDVEAGMMYKFDETGICVDVRPLLVTERQRVIKLVNDEKTA